LREHPGLARPSVGHGLPAVHAPRAGGACGDWKPVTLVPRA
jgi:hypothetical protein